MPRIMGIGNVSGLSKKHKPKRAGSFKGMGIILEGDPKRLRGLGKKRRGLRGTPEQHEATAVADWKLAKALLKHAEAAKTCKQRTDLALMAVKTASWALRELNWTRQKKSSASLIRLQARAQRVVTSCLKR